jgi:hypothetical protein
MHRIDGMVTRQVRSYLSSLPGDAKVIAHAVRSHWGIEHQAHWVLDVAFWEDQSRARIGRHSAANLAPIRPGRSASRAAASTLAGTTPISSTSSAFTHHFKMR